ncbi:MAG TPA: carboxypeptidase regulatory-like domain-containing protein [Edaphobacter sp.]|nr:carboxypeptidase regulatory-like domain-containing protein [Edaphobacter sp.]
MSVCLFSLTCLAQTPQGTIAGTVTDASGAAIAGAEVTAVSLETNDTRTAKTNATGAYRIDAVLPGDYKVSSTAEGFGMASTPSAHVTSSVVTSVNLVLQVGGTTASVDVSTEGELLRTDSGELSNTLDAREVQNLPIATLNPYSLAVTLPGVAPVKTVDLTNSGSYSVNGARPRDNNFLIEGMDNNDQGIHGQAFQPANTEAVQEVTFLLNSFPAEFGHGGSVSNLIYRSGTNQFHGAVWDRLYNSSLDATDHNDVLNKNPKAKYRENVYGFRIGGPIVHDKAFFFVSTQWDHRRETANLGVLTLPTDAGYAKLQQYASNPRVATLLAAYGTLRGTNPLYAKTIALGPDPANPSVDRGTVDFAGVQRSLGNQINSYELIAKGDVNMSAADKLQLRFIQSPLSTPYDVGNFPNQLPGFDTMQSGDTHNAGIIETHIFSPSLLNEIRLNWSRIGFGFDLRPETKANPLSVQPVINISGITGYGVPTSVPQGRYQNTYVLQDAVSLNRGNHFMKFGFDISDIRVRDQAGLNIHGSIPYTNQVGGAHYTALANFIDDFAGTNSSLATITFGNPIARPEIWSQNYYAQDTWKLRPNLSVDFGARYEYNGAPFNYLGYPAFNANDPACFPCNVKQVADKNNIAPRLGFNWSPVPNGKTVISGGFGLFYSHIFTNIIDNIQTSAPNTALKQIRSTTAGRGTANWSGVLGRITNKNPLPTDTANVIASNLVDPENYQWNLRVQRELPASFVFSAAYVGNRGVHQYATTEFNPTVAGGPRVIPTRGRIIREDNSNDSMYHAGQFSLEHKTHAGLTFRGNYTYSKLLDTGSELFTPSSGNWSTYAERQYPNPRRYEWGPSAFDLRHVFSFSYVYTPPVWHAEGAAKAAAAVVNGWTISGVTSVYSGTPINVEIGYDWNGDGINNDRPALANPKAPLNTWAVRGDDPNLWATPTAGYCDGTAAFYTADPCHPVAFDQVHWVTGLFYGQGDTISRNAVYAKFNQQWDMSLQRTFKLFETHAVDFRAESFNLFNHALTNQPGYAVKSSLTTDASNNPLYGANTFLDYGLTNSGGRQLRFLLKYSF